MPSPYDMHRPVRTRAGEPATSSPASLDLPMPGGPTMVIS